MAGLKLLALFNWTIYRWHLKLQFLLFFDRKEIFVYTGQFVILKQVKIGFKFIKIRRPKTPKKCM